MYTMPEAKHHLRPYIMNFYFLNTMFCIQKVGHRIAEKNAASLKFIMIRVLS